jgi:hypothetical protein
VFIIPKLDTDHRECSGCGKTRRSPIRHSIASKATRERSDEAEHEGRNQRQSAGGEDTIKETFGQVSHHPNLTVQLQNEELAGQVQRKVGQMEKVLQK